MEKVNAWLVLGAGALGGGLSWLFAATVGLAQPLPWWKAIPAAVLLGAAAGYVGVYLLAATDLSQVNRCLAFALLCGMSWKPVFEAGSALVAQSLQKKETRREAARLEARSSQLVDELKSAPPAAVPAIIGQAGETARVMADMAQRAEGQDPELAATLRLRAAETVAAAARAAPPNEPLPPLPVEQLRRELEDSRRKLAERDPGRAQSLAAAKAELERAAARK